MATREGRIGRTRRILACACAAMLVAAGVLWAPPRAEAYLVRDPVYVGLSQTDVHLMAGESTAISCVIDPMSEAQLPGCMDAHCPEECGGEMGCLDANGWCTCAGMGYVTYDTTVMVLSSDPSVARADWSGGVLTVSAYEEPGTVTITLTASLRNHQPDVTEYVTVTVDPIPEVPGGGEDEYVSDATINGQGDANTNVVNGTGDADNAYLGTGAQGEGASYDKPAAADAATGASTEAPAEVPEIPVEPDVTQPAVVLYELAEVEDEEEDDSPIDPAYAGGTAAMGALCVGFGAVRHAEQRRRQLQ